MTVFLDLAKCVTDAKLARSSAKRSKLHLNHFFLIHIKRNTYITVKPKMYIAMCILKSHVPGWFSYLSISVSAQVLISVRVVSLSPALGSTPSIEPHLKKKKKSHILVVVHGPCLGKHCQKWDELWEGAGFPYCLHN